MCVKKIKLRLIVVTFLATQDFGLTSKKNCNVQKLKCKKNENGNHQKILYQFLKTILFGKLMNFIYSIAGSNI